MAGELPQLDFDKPEFGPEYLRGLLRETNARDADRRRRLGLPEDGPNTFMGYPVVSEWELDAE